MAAMAQRVAAQEAGGGWRWKGGMGAFWNERSVQMGAQNTRGLSGRLGLSGNGLIWCKLYGKAVVEKKRHELSERSDGWKVWSSRELKQCETYWKLLQISTKN